jgi:hypothetical protein
MATNRMKRLIRISYADPCESYHTFMPLIGRLLRVKVLVNAVTGQVK